MSKGELDKTIERMEKRGRGLYIDRNIAGVSEL